MSLDGSARESARIGPYRLIQRLGEGGMGVVHLALDPAGTAVAVKVLRPHIAADPDARRRLAREVATLRRVRHPRVAAVIDADVECEVPYLVTNFVPGKPLDAHVRDHGPLPRGHVARVGSVLAEALRAIHACGIVHRDVKPANVMLLDGDPILIDFGIAHDADESRITHTGLVMGTPGYLSPEIIGGDPVTAATDWWGWGATLAFAATGRPPFGTGPIEVVLDRVRRGQSDIDGVDAGLRATLTAALAVDPARRPTPDRLVAGLAAVAPVRNGARTANPAPDGVAAIDREATTARTPPPPEARTTKAPAAGALASPAEAITAVVPPPVVWAAPALPETKRFDPPSRPPNGRRDASGAPANPPPGPLPVRPANGFSSGDSRYQTVGPSPAWPSSPPPWSPQQPSPPGPANQPGSAGRGDPRSQPDQQAERAQRPVVGDPSRGLPLGLLVVLAAIAGVAPYGAFWIATLGMIVARLIDRSSTALLLRRDQRGPRGSDGLVLALASPWRLLGAGVATMLALILPILIGISVTFIAATAWAGAPTEAIPGQPGPLAAGMVALLLTAWWGPGGGSLRRGTGKSVKFVCPSPRARIIVWAVLGLILISALSVARSGAHPDWGPLNSKVVDMLSRS
jgi:serine/threonine protein kinase